MSFSGWDRISHPLYTYFVNKTTRIEVTSLTVKKVWRYKTLFLMTLPGLVYLLINNYLPMAGLVIAFKNVNYVDGIWGSPWVGFKNFEYLFKTSDALLITRNTLLYNAAFIVLNLVFAVALAILFNEVKKRLLSRLFQSALLIPYLISSVIIGYLVYSLLSQDLGLINTKILHLFGLEAIPWYSSPEYWPYILVLVNIWKSVGYLSVIYFAAIMGIDNEYYEAATIDGASKWTQTMRITVPLIMPIIIIMTLLQIGRILYADFGLFYQVPMDSGALLPVTNVIDTYVYRTLIKLGDIGMSSAAGFYQAIVGFILIVTSNAIVRKIDRDQAMF